jgi:hypothetical protein
LPNLVDGCDLTPVCGNGNHQPAWEWFRRGGGMFEKNRQKPMTAWALIRTFFI